MSFLRIGEFVSCVVASPLIAAHMWFLAPDEQANGKYFEQLLHVFILFNFV